MPTGNGAALRDRAEGCRAAELRVRECPLPSVPVRASAMSSGRQARAAGVLLKAAEVNRMRHCVEFWGSCPGVSVRGGCRWAVASRVPQARRVRWPLARSAV
jgi:hypothetical protein